MSALTSGSRQLRRADQLFNLNGTWSFTSQGARTQSIEVPALWESQGHLNLDGEVVYHREFELSENQLSNFSTLRFEAVMDSAEVSLNGNYLGRHDNPFTPFEINCSGKLIAGKNLLVVKVVDYPRNSVEHIRSAHGKQGWANQEFPSPPSVYMTLGGIYRDVSLHLHKAVVIRNLAADCNSENLNTKVEIENLDPKALSARIEIFIFGQKIIREVILPPLQLSIIEFSTPSANQLPWKPNSPFLHELEVKIFANEVLYDEASLRFGLRSITQENGKIYINGEEIFIRAALVQGFYPDTIYGEPVNQKIKDEILKAKKLGLNTLRLHIKAFDSRYLDACDELGMLLHCDIPIAEPISHDELASDTEVARNCAAAVVAQVRRDFSHPSIFLWSVMNELGLEKIEVRKQSGYKAFVIAMYDTLFALDKSRPIIENDWIDPDPEYVFRSQILTSHWYGRLDSRYLKSLRDRTEFWGKDGRFFYISEFGDWGLPNMPTSDDAEFWSYHDYYSDSLDQLPWSASNQSLIDGTQKYMGVSNKLQIETFRSTDGVNGFCVTELTDIPWELNGLLDYRRNIKAGALKDFSAANQEILPILEFDYAGATRGESLPLTLHIHNSSNVKQLVQATIKFTSGVPITLEVELVPHGVTHSRGLLVTSQSEKGVDELTVALTYSGEVVSSNSYEVPVYLNKNVSKGIAVNFLSEVGLEILRDLDLVSDPLSKNYVIGENALSAELGSRIQLLLQDGASVLVLAQDIERSKNFPIEVKAIASTTEWGGTDFHFTGGNSKVFGPNKILTIEDLNIRPDVIFSNSGDSVWPDQTHAGVFKPMPRPRSGYIVGEKQVGAGRLITCQYRLNATRELASTRDIALSVLNLFS